MLQTTDIEEGQLLSERLPEYIDWIHPHYEDVLRSSGLYDYNALLRTMGDESLDKRSLEPWRQRIKLTLETPKGPCDFYLKRFTRPPLAHQIKYRFRRFASTAHIEWVWLDQLPSHHIAVAVPIVVGARHQMKLELDSLILMKTVPGRSLEEWLPAAERSGLFTRRLQRALIQKTADMISRLHGCGLIHRDLYLSHIFIDDSDTENPQLYLIDLQRMFRPQMFRDRWIVKDLAALNYSVPRRAASNADRLRWFKAYLGINRLNASYKRQIQKIADKTARIARHSQKHGLG